jgi:DNA polymerase
VLHSFLQTFCAVHERFDPERVFVVWDHPSAYRKQRFAEYRASLAPEALATFETGYKASRKSTWTEAERHDYQTRFLPQQAALKTIIPALGAKTLAIPDVEGDDLIGLAATRVQDEGGVAVLVSSDKDLYQLLSPAVLQYDPQKEKTFTAADFEQAYGIPPERWADVKALWGDKGDDIPGVPTIGEKNALKFMQLCPGLPTLLTTDVPKNLQKKHARIKEHWEQVKFSYDLAFIVNDPSLLTQEQQAIWHQQWDAPTAIEWSTLQHFADQYELRRVWDSLRVRLMTPEYQLAQAASLNALYDTWGNCQRCPLSTTRHNIVTFDGPTPCRVMAIGEGPGASEDFYGKPFQGRAGEYWNTFCLGAHKIPRSSIHVTNLVCCRPTNDEGENRPPKPEETAACGARLRHHIRIVDPEYIILMGDKPYKAFFPNGGPITRDRGCAMQHPLYPGITFIPTFHPSYLMRLTRTHSDIVKANGPRGDWAMIAKLLNTEPTETSEDP